MIKVTTTVKIPHNLRKHFTQMMLHLSDEMNEHEASQLTYEQWLEMINFYTENMIGAVKYLKKNQHHSKVST